MAELRPNRAKRKLLAGLPVLAPALGAGNVPDNDMLELLGAQGTFDVAWIEMEHGATTWRELSDIARVCDLTGLTSMVRVNLNDPAIIGRALDRGIQSVLVPHVNTREEALRLVEGAYYAPKGLRGMASPRQSYGVANYHQKVNDEIMTVALLEDIQAIRNLDQILTVEGVDVFFVGPGDLGQTMGAKYVGQSMHPDVQALVRDAVKTITAAGRVSGTIVNENNVEEYIALGARMLRQNATTYLTEGLKRFHAKVNSAIPLASS